jgi:hypothetical protein
MFGHGNIESAQEVELWKKKIVLGQSLYNPEALGDLGTHMYLLNKWYMQASKETNILVSELETNIGSVAMTLCMFIT